MERGAEPVHTMTARAFVVWPPTSTPPSAVSRPCPSMIVTLRLRSSPLSPVCSCWTIPLFLALSAGQSVTAVAPSGSRKPNVSAWPTVRYTSAACSRAFAGMHPRCRQVPPTFLSSTRAILSPAEAPYSAAA